MRPPEQGRLAAAQPRAGRRFEDELHLRYLGPGAFTVLSHESSRPPPEPPAAPDPYRLTSTRQHKNKSFAIIGELDSSRANSRSSSPSGRTSPFRGRGFNPAGSRHASPSPSPPPPEDSRHTPTKRSPSHTSKIPQLKRRGSNVAFGEKVYHHNFNNNNGSLARHLSRSLGNLEPQKMENVANKTTTSNRKGKTPAFQRLSPIVGSSPEPSQSQSSPSRIPKSRSTPPSRKTSPSRNYLGRPPQAKPVASRNTSRSQSRNPSRNQSRNPSREQSPSKLPPSPARKYKNVQAKVNSFNRPKPKVPPKPQMLSEQTSESDSGKTVHFKSPTNRKESVGKSRTNSKSNLLPKTGNYAKNTNYNSTSDSSASTNKAKTNSNNNANNVKTVDEPTKVNNSLNVENNQNNNKNNNINIISTTSSVTNSTKNTDGDTTTDTEPSAKSKSSDATVKAKMQDNVTLNEMLPSTTTIVSTTTTTVTQPLKIETKLIPTTKQYETKPVSPMVDGRVLSATSVSNAMNRMNDTVLNSQTVMRERGYPKLSPAAHAVIAVANETTKSNNNNSTNQTNTNAAADINNPALDTKNAVTALPKIEPAKTNNTNNNNNTTIGHVMSAKALGMEVAKTMRHETSSNSVNERMKEARTVVAHDVMPIRITVREKPSDADVQSGNVRLASGIANGVSERPSLPPAQQTPPNEPEKPPPPKNVCTKFLGTVKQKMACKCCHRSVETDTKTPVIEADKTGCFACLRKKKGDVEETVPARITIEDETGGRCKCIRKLCSRNDRVGDRTSCFPLGKRKESWVAKREDSNLSLSSPARSKCSKDCCKDALRKVFCINLCCKKKVVDEPVRKPSVMSKKKSLTPTSVPPPEDVKPKIDMSLVEHTSHMKGAIPILPVCLAWFCLVINCIVPGAGTFLSGLFCLCIGIPRFSQKDGPKGRIGSFIINTIIGFSQFFTVLFCLVGWGWSVWWGVIMIKVARKHKKIKQLEAFHEVNQRVPVNNRLRDPERQN